jgi:hypothetical protein
LGYLEVPEMVRKKLNREEGREEGCKIGSSSEVRKLNREEEGREEGSKFGIS